MLTIKHWLYKHFAAWARIDAYLSRHQGNTVAETNHLALANYWQAKADLALFDRDYYAS